jgi:hypothetical protein
MTVLGKQLAEQIRNIVSLDLKRDSLLLQAELRSRTLRLGHEVEELVFVIAKSEFGPELEGLSQRLLKMTEGLRKPYPDDDPIIEIAEKSLDEISKLGRFQMLELASTSSHSRDKVLGFLDQLDKRQNELSRSLTMLRQIRTRLFAARTKASQVTAVLRPLQPKYLDIWKSENLNGLNFEQVRIEAGTLLKREISTYAEFKSWIDDILEFFSKVAVTDVGETGNSAATSALPARRPQGSIRRSSERAYKVRWTSWIYEHTDSLMKFIEDPESYAESESVSRLVSSKGFKIVDARVDSISLERQPSVKTKRSEDESSKKVSYKLLVRVEDSSDGDVSAERVWNTKPSNIEEISNWVATIVKLWGESVEKVKVKISLTGPDGTSTIAMPNMELGSLTERLVTSLEV